MRTWSVLVVLATAVCAALAIKCFVCNSHVNKTCFNDDLNDSFLLDCQEKPGNKEHPYTLCRKVFMKMDMDFGENHPRENRVHRDCAYEGDADCYYKSGYNTRQWVCACNDKDGCNSAPLVASLNGLLLGTITALILASNFVVF